MKRAIIFLAISLSLLSCHNKTSDKGNEAGKTADSEMKVAIQTAKITFPDFKKAYCSHIYDSTGFAIKVRFPNSRGGAEHFWTSQLSYHDGAFWGAVNEMPIDTTIKVKAGEVFKIDTAAISDWEYIDGRYLVGAYTTRVLRKHMSPEEGRRFDSIWAKMMFN